MEKWSEKKKKTFCPRCFSSIRDDGTCLCSEASTASEAEARLVLDMCGLQAIFLEADEVL